MSENNFDQSEDKFVWSHEATCELIQMYKKYPALYATINSDYKNREKRQEALKAIRAEMLRTGRKISIEDIKKKIHGLRTQYTSQLAKMKKNPELKPTLWCFKQLDFLRNSYDGQQNKPENENFIESEFFGVHEQTNDSQEGSFYDNLNTVKQETRDFTDTSVFTTTPDPSRRHKNDDELETFGKLVELELRKINQPGLLRKAKREIINILMDAQESCDD